MTDEPLRPDPDKLLAAEEGSSRGKLKIFFGACAGVGKTYAMLQEAQRLHAQGLDVILGVIETHGRDETAALTEGLPRLAARRFNHQGRTIDGFDLDAALARHPALILVDELACSNPGGARHPRRWQDIEELLNAGIDGFTTVNVQHLESLNAVVGGVTGIQVRETVPDPFFDSASEIVLVDLPVDDLRQRLKEGKVYLAGQAERAIENFFRKGNLIALRELALRRTADRVDSQMRAWRDRFGEERVWHTRDAILLCIGQGDGNEKLVRSAARLAARLGSEWHAVYVETPRLHRLAEADRRKILRALHLAQELGATTTTLADNNEPQAIVRYAREHNLGKIITGRRQRRTLSWRAGFVDRLVALAPDLDVMVISIEERDVAPQPAGDYRARLGGRWRSQWRGAIVAIILCTLITLIASQWLAGFDTANLVMLYLAGVVVIALRYGRGPAALAAVLNVVSFDLFFINPRGTLAVSDAQYVLTFGVMLVVGLTIGNLTAGMRYQARVARYRERRTHYLYELARSLARTRTPAEIAVACEEFSGQALRARCQLLAPNASGELLPLNNDSSLSGWDEAIARWSFTHSKPSGAGTDTLPGVPWQMVPLRTGGQTTGLLIVEPENLRQLMVPEQQRLLETVALLLATALERLNLTTREEQARLASEREGIRNALLAALSHDLRTPLTVLFGQAEILTLDLAAAGSPHAPQANEIRQQVLNTTRLVNNLLDMARIQSGGFIARKEWLTLEETIGSALNMVEPLLGDNKIVLSLPDPLLLIDIDGPLFERVLINLLENAIKYAGLNATIGITAQSAAEYLDLEVWDDGPGIPPGQEQAIFEKFARGAKESSIPGIGLGLAICRAIVTLHNGTIYAANRPQGGASFHIHLPLAPAPELTEFDEAP